MDTNQHAGRSMPETPIRQEITRCLLSYNSRLAAHQRLTRAAVESRTQLVQTVIREAWSLGHQILRPQNLGLTLATKVLNSWRQRGLARTTVACRWSALHYFAVAIDKGGMLPPLEQLWPAAAEEKTPGPRRRTLAHLSAEQYQQLISKLSPSEPTYWVVRLERELDLTRRQALATNFVIGTSRVAGMLIASDRGGQKTKAVSLADTTQKELVDQVLQYLSQRQRKTLCWPRMSMTAAQRKVTNAIAYQLRSMDCESAEGEQDE